jgi:hypothetical protein
MLRKLREILRRRIKERALKKTLRIKHKKTPRPRREEETWAGTQIFKDGVIAPGVTRPSNMATSVKGLVATTP